MKKKEKRGLIYMGFGTLGAAVGMALIKALIQGSYLSVGVFILTVFGLAFFIVALLVVNKGYYYITGENLWR